MVIVWEYSFYSSSGPLISSSRFPLYPLRALLLLSWQRRRQQPTVNRKKGSTLYEAVGIHAQISSS